jgi:high-affinity iron transporter
VFAGQGVAALQEAGVVSITPVAFVALPVIGVFPTVQTLAVQLAMLLIVAASFYLAGRRSIARSERAA